MAPQSASSSRTKAFAVAISVALLAGCAAPAPAATPTTPAVAAPTSTKAPAATVTPTTAAIRFEGGKLQPLPDGFPKNSITLLAPSPGSSSDLFFRALAKVAGPLSPVPLVVENLSGTATILRNAELAMDKAGGPEGYALFISTFSQTARAFQQAPGKAKWSDIGPPIVAIADQYAVSVRADSPWKGVADFVKYAKENPGRASIGGTDPGGMVQISMDTLARLTGFEYTYVPHDSAADALNTLIGGGVDAAMGNIPNSLPQVKAGKIRIIGITSARRSPVFPEVPTLIEQGYNVALENFRGAWALATVPKQRIEWLQELFRRGTDTLEFKDYLAGTGETYLAASEFAKEYRETLVPTIEQAVRAAGLHYEQQPR